MDKLRIAFAGTPLFSRAILQKLIDEQFNIVCVYTQPDKKQGRGQKISHSPVKELALQHNIQIEQPAKLRNAEQAAIFEKYQADVLIVVAYGLIIPQTFLDLPRYGAINIHTSLLPKWRGAAPVQRAILSGDKTTGVTIMQMDASLDTGDILLQQTCEISAQDTTTSLFDKLNVIAQQLIVATLHNIDNLQAIKQDDNLASYAAKIDKSEGIINWNEDAAVIVRKLNAFTPWPGLTTTLHNGTTVKIIAANVISNNQDCAPGTIIEINKQGIIVATNSECLNITRLQFAGKKAISHLDVLNSNYKDLLLKNNFTTPQ